MKNGREGEPMHLSNNRRLYEKIFSRLPTPQHHHETHASEELPSSIELMRIATFRKKKAVQENNQQHSREKDQIRQPNRHLPAGNCLKLTGIRKQTRQRRFDYVAQPREWSRKQLEYPS